MTRYPLRITHRRMETPDTVSLGFGVPQDLRHLFAHQPGQFLSIALEVDGDEIERSYSISSLPQTHDHVRITVKRVPGGKASNWLVDHAAVGSVLETALPRGRFFDPPAAPVHAVLLGAGSGVAPLVPIARHLCGDGQHRVTLVCGQRTEPDLILRDELEALDREACCDVKLRLTRPGPVWTGGRGRVDAAHLAEQLPRWRESGLPLVFYICGPEAFMAEAEAALLALQVPADAIRKESFALAAQEDTGEPGIVVHGAEHGVDGDCTELRAAVVGEEFGVRPEPGESLLASLLRAGASVPYSCQEGTCASCIAKLKHGTVDLRPAALQVLPQKDIDTGLILACLAHPRSQCVHIDFDDL